MPRAFFAYPEQLRPSTEPVRGVRQGLGRKKESLLNYRVLCTEIRGPVGQIVQTDRGQIVAVTKGQVCSGVPPEMNSRGHTFTHPLFQQALLPPSCSKFIAWTHADNSVRVMRLEPLKVRP